MKSQLSFWQTVHNDFSASDQEYICNCSPTFKALWSNHEWRKQLQSEMRDWLQPNKYIRAVAEYEDSEALIIRTVAGHEDLVSRRPTLLEFIEHKIAQLS